MFERFKKMIAGAPEAGIPADQLPAGAGLPNPVAQWAHQQGLSYVAADQGRGFVMTGKIAGKPLKLERGRSSREYIEGEELRARADLQLNEDAVVLVLNRSLKDALEKSAYLMYTDTLQTTADPKLPEEMRWLAMYEEVGWGSLSTAFLQRYAVLADDRHHAELLLDNALAELMMSWPVPSPGPDVPVLLMLLRGKLYLRMQYSPADLPTLAHAALIFQTACGYAVDGLSTDISI